jgi:hypothetical protein
LLCFFFIFSSYFILIGICFGCLRLDNADDFHHRIQRLFSFQQLSFWISFSSTTFATYLYRLSLFVLYFFALSLCTFLLYFVFLSDNFTYDIIYYDNTSATSTSISGLATSQPRPDILFIVMKGISGHPYTFPYTLLFVIVRLLDFHGEHVYDVPSQDIPWVSKSDGTFFNPARRSFVHVVTPCFFSYYHGRRVES